ncbi:hypothetical protein [Pseudodesulfovibrio aespoeensis]|uniref:hypothetical protein n=1 Tax=Pseudodesulfovibrio aespoeensis TaxID=182210 RepID=UPI00235653DD|nr:hypothetical protein [Pseudodesulfovibrio aespoeensis]
MATMREKFSFLVETWKNSLYKHVDSIQKSFDGYAKEFLFETCTLSWSPQFSKLGQLQQKEIEYPAFALDMTGADFPEASRRSGPDEVSESQREFIDLSFRMALMETAGGGGTSLIIDAPESSLDAIFVDKAALVLSQIGSPDKKNCLIITSNIVDGKLIPNLLTDYEKEDRSSRIVDLFSLAAKTAAVKQNIKLYVEKLNDLINVD